MICVDISKHTYADPHELAQLHKKGTRLLPETASLSDLETALLELRYEVAHQAGRGVEELIVFAPNGASLASIILIGLAEPATT